MSLLVSRERSMLWLDTPMPYASDACALNCHCCSRRTSHSTLLPSDRSALRHEVHWYIAVTCAVMSRCGLKYAVFASVLLLVFSSTQVATTWLGVLIRRSYHVATHAWFRFESL